jgi:hypothetical protein
MILKELGILWGNPVIKLRDYAKKYRVLSILLYAIDVVALSILTALMYKQGSSFQTYMFIIVLFVVIFSLIFNMYLNTNKWAAFKFYKRHQHDKVTVKKYKVDASNLYSVIYCMNYRRLKQDKDYEDYLEMIENACNEDCSFAKSVMKYLRKYEDEETGNLEVYTITKGKHQYFVGYVSEAENTTSDDNVEDKAKDNETN